MTPTKSDLEAAKTTLRAYGSSMVKDDEGSLNDIAIHAVAEIIATAHQAERDAGKRLDELCDLLLHDFAVDKARLANAISEYRKSIE